MNPQDYLEYIEEADRRERHARQRRERRRAVYGWIGVGCNLVAIVVVLCPSVKLARVDSLVAWMVAAGWSIIAVKDKD